MDTATVQGNKQMKNEAKTYTHQQLETAVRDYLCEKSLQNRENVVMAAEGLIRHFALLYSPGIMDEDLKQAGYEGLLKALKRFDPDRGIQFSTYAANCIIGEIRHELRNRSSFYVPEWLKSLQAKIIDATEALAQENGAMPTLKEISNRINVNSEGIAEAMQAGCVPLDDIDWSRFKHIRYQSFKLPIEDVIAVKIALSKMDSLQQKVVTLIYYEGLTQEQVASKLGLNQRKVSRMLKNSLKEMHAYVV